MKQDPKSIMTSALASAKVSSVIETGRLEGRSDEEIAYEALGGADGIADMARDLHITLLLSTMGELVGFAEPMDNKAFVGLAYILQHYPDAPAAKRYSAMYENSTTVMDIMAFFLNENGLTEEVFLKHPDYDREHFENLLLQPIDKVKRFTLGPT